MRWMPIANMHQLSLWPLRVRPRPVRGIRGSDAAADLDRDLGALRHLRIATPGAAKRGGIEQHRDRQLPADRFIQPDMAARGMKHSIVREGFNPRSGKSEIHRCTASGGQSVRSQYRR